MKNTFLMLMAMTAILSFSFDAQALSIDHRDTTNDDGTPKFADPDEQTPPGLVMNDNESGSGAPAPFYPPAITHQNAPGLPDASRQGEEQFNNAFSHLQGNQ